MNNIEISQSTMQKVLQAKKYLQKKYNMNKISREKQQQNWQIFQQKIKELNLSIQQKQQTKNRIVHSQMEELRKKRHKISKKDFQSIAIIGRGAFGQVRLCREKKNDRVVAIKCLKKKQMIKKNQQIHLKAERNILADGGQWIVNLIYSFQDQNYLFLVMEYMAGGDLMNILIQKNVISQGQAKFYAAEIVLAIESIHQKKYIHRDLKPDNVLIDNQGHIKLTDFGLSKHTQVNKQSINSFHYSSDIENQRRSSDDQKRQDRRTMAFSAVGTPDYISPQMLKRTGYNQLIDWWALGVMIYEMIIGYAPFSSDSNQQTYFKIQNHEDYLYFPPEVQMSYEVIDLISKLLTDQTTRLGINGSQQIKSHEWFKGINWNQIRKMKPPFVPELKSKIDTQYFDQFQQLEPWNDDFLNLQSRKDLNFIGYTFKKQIQSEKNIIQEQLQKLQKNKEAQTMRPRIDMRKKKIKVTANYPHQYQSKPLILTPKLTIKQSTYTPQINTDRSRTLKSKSPLQIRDTNRMKTRQSVSKSPLKKQTSYSKENRLALNKKYGFKGLLNSLAHKEQLNKTIALRKTLKAYK